MIPREPFVILCDCEACEKNTKQECVFQSWEVEKHDVFTIVTCLVCDTGKILVFTEDDYHYLQSELPQPILN